MKELFKRSITGILYVFVLLSAAMLSTEAFNFLFLVFGLAGLYEFKKIIKLSGYYIFLSFLGLWWLFIYLIEDFQQKQSLALVLLTATLLTNFFLLSELFNKKKTKYTNTGRFVVSLFYIGTGCIFLTMIPYYEHHFAKFLIIIYIYQYH